MGIPDFVAALASPRLRGWLVAHNSIAQAVGGTYRRLHPGDDVPDNLAVHTLFLDPKNQVCRDG